jgi:hypothetical protein
VIAAHNGPYDFAVLLRHRPDAWPVVIDAFEAGVIHDTMTAEWLIDTAKGLLRMELDEETGEYKYTKSYSLEAIAISRLRIMPFKDQWRMRYAELYDTPLECWPEDAARYPQDDARNTFLVAEHQRMEAALMLPHDPLAADLSAQCRAYLALHLASAWGMAIDPAAAKDLDRRLHEECERLADSGLVEAGLLLRQVRGKSIGKLNRKLEPLRQRVLEDFAKRGAEVPLTDGGKNGDAKQIKCSSDVLASCDDPLLKIMSEYLHAQKMLGYSERLLSLGRGPLHPRYAWATTGRTTCSGGKKRKGSVYALNVQNFPRKMPGTLEGQSGVRECSVARDGHVFSSTDFAGLELCTWAQVLTWMIGPSQLAAAINGGQDVHTRMAANLLGVEYEDALALIAAKDPRAKDARQIAKVLNFGLPGGMGALKFVMYAKAQGLNISEEQARKLKADWLKTWPEARAYFKLIGDLVGDGSSTITQLTSERVRGDVGYTDACNSFFQGLAADGAKAALWQIMVECYDERKKSVLLGSRVVAFIHDEYLCEHPEEIAAEAAKRVGEIAVKVMSEWCPDVKIKAEPALMERWSKSAGDPVYDKSGRLIPWEKRDEVNQGKILGESRKNRKMLDVASGD